MDFPHMVFASFWTFKVILSSGKEKKKKTKELFSKMYLILEL